MAGASWHDLDTGRALRGALAIESAAWRGWVRRAERLNLTGWAAIRKLGPCPDRYLLPGGEEGGRVWLPRHAPGAVWSPAAHPEADRLEMSADLRGYQADGLEAWRAARGRGVVVCPCGGGKTVVACQAIARTPSPALVLVHTLDLIEQWRERVSSFLPGASIGQIGGGKKTLGRVTIATIQTLAKWARRDIEELGAGFGLVVADECHHVPASSWSWVMSCFPGPWRLGLTATPGRDDGLESWIYWTIGLRVATIQQSVLQEEGAVLVPEIRRVKTGWNLPEGLDGKRWDVVCRAIAGDEGRNEVLRRELLAEVEQGRTVLALVLLVPHAYALAELCGGVALTGETARGERRRILEAVRSGGERLVFATSLADEGLDLPAADTMALCWPEHRLGVVEQRVGRALRPRPGKEARVIDFLDEWKPLMGWSSKRAKLYRAKGWSK